jgi:DNA-binding MarR family transcriptional regulator/GNAT superfamily N-acetyltransferase
VPAVDPETVENIREASRRMVRELGFMNSTVAATDLPPSAVHAILEIGTNRPLTAAQLGPLLNLEKSSVSRMVRKLIRAGELAEATSETDGRAKVLTLTAKGRNTCAAINAFGRRQVSAALGHLSAEQQSVVVAGLAAYAQALGASRHGRPAASTIDPVEIVTGYRPGVIGRAVEMHARFYAGSAGFGSFFEAKVAAGLAEFASRLDNPKNGLWTAIQSDRVVGVIAIDGEDLQPAGSNDVTAPPAHLRWFIVEDGLRGAGLGRRLLTQAIAFCDRHRFATTQLWTFQGLDAARRLYETAGFILAEQWPGSQWGKTIIEQRFVRAGPADQVR